jgi:hypothetical protein
MNVLNRICTALFGVLLAPFEVWPPLLTLLVWSVLIGVVMAVVFRFTSNQRALTVVADRSRSHLLAIKLFQDDLGVTLRCQFELLKSVGRRLWYSLPPMLVLIVPFILILSQLGLRFEHNPLQVGEAAVVELRLSPQAWKNFVDVSIDVPSTVEVQTPALRDQTRHTVLWRLSPKEPSSFAARWELDGQVVEKRIAVAGSRPKLIPVSIQRPGPTVWDRLFHPMEPGFNIASPVRSITVRHEIRSTPVFGADVPWWVTLLVVSCLSALLVKPIVKVQF